MPRPRSTSPAPPAPSVVPARSVRCALSVALPALLLLLFAPTPASAHAVLEHSTPADAAVLDTTPSTATLTFDEPVGRVGAAVHLAGPAGDVSTGSPTFSGSSVQIPLTGDQPAGAYTLSWRVVSDDGHPVSGQVRWTLHSSGTATPLAGAQQAGRQTAQPAAQQAGKQSGGSLLSQHGGHLLLAWAVILLGVVYLGFDVWRRRHAKSAR